MAKNRFTGFPLGAQVTLQAVLSGTTAGPTTTSTWGQQSVSPTSWEGPSASETLTVTVNEIRPGGIDYAPVGVEFRIAVSGSPIGNTPDVTDDTAFQLFDPTFSQIQYVTHTGDTGNYRNSRIGHASHRDKAFQYGQNPGHVYSNPGVYSNRSVYVYDESGNWGTATLPDLTVVDPLTISSSQRIVIAPDGDFSGAPAHDTANRCTTPQQFEALWNDTNDNTSLKEVGTVHVTAKPGSTWSGYNSIALGLEEMGGKAVFDTWDNSDVFFYDERNAPLSAEAEENLFETVSGNASRVCPLAMQNWHFNFGFDRTAGAPDTGINGTYKRIRGLLSGDERRFNSSIGLIGARHVFHNVDVSGCGGAVVSNGDPDWVGRHHAVFFNDCLFQDNNEYVYFQPSNLFMLGCQSLESTQNDLGSMGRSRIGGTQRGYKGHVGIRESTAWVIYQRACFWENRGGWSGQNPGQTGYSNQRLFRHQENSSNDGRVGKRFFYCDSVFLGSFRLDWIKTGFNGMHFIVENSFLSYNPMSSANDIIGHHGGRKTVRNNMFVVLDAPKLTSGASALSSVNLDRFENPPDSIEAGQFTRMIEYAYMKECVDDPAETLHNTFVMLRADADVEGTFEMRNDTYDATDVSGHPSGGPYPVSVDVDTVYPITEGHNVVYAPNLATPQGPTMDTIALPSTGADGVRVLDMAVRWMWERVEYDFPSSVGPGQTTATIPYPVGTNNVQTVQSDYSGTNSNHGLRIENGSIDFSEQPGEGNSIPDYPESITVTFGASGFTVTNNSDQTWGSGETALIILDRGTTSMQPITLHTINNTPLALYRPQTAQALDSGVKSTLFDFGRSRRPGAGFAISPSGTNTAGALLPD